MTEPPEKWPDGVEEIKITDLKRLGIDKNRELYWDGQRIEVRRRLDLTRAQKFLAVLVALFAVLGGIGGFVSGFTDATDFLCARNICWLSCPAPAADAPD
jgi:hypothetical protein